MQSSFEIIKAPTAYYSEESQFINCQFSLAKYEETINKKIIYRELFSPVICRDFLGDVIYANSYKKPVSIYRFKYDPTQQNNTEEEFENKVEFPILLYFENEEQKANFLTNFALLTEIENKIMSITTNVWVKTRVAIVFCPPFWTRSIWLMSLYTFMLRCFCYPPSEGNFWEYIGTTGQKEASYIERVDIFKIIKNLVPLGRVSSSITGYPEESNLTIHQIHNASGFISLFGNHIKNNVYSDWYNTNVKNNLVNKAA